MKLRTQILLARGVISTMVSVLLLAAAQTHWIAAVCAGAWLAVSRRVMHRLVLPQLFPYARCKNRECGYMIPLVQYWGCKGGHYKHHAPTHALAYCCCDGHVIKSFECPRCNRSTVQLQKGTSGRLCAGVIHSNPMLMSAAEDRPTMLRSLIRRLCRRVCHDEKRFLLGTDPAFRLPPLHRVLRRLLRRPLTKEVWVPESTYGRHMAFIGATGQGKSVLLTSIIKQKMEAGEGLTVIDPTGDLITDVLRHVPWKRRDDVLLIRPSDPHCGTRMNLLHAHDEIEEININNEVLSSLQRLARSWGDNIALQIDRAIDTVRLVGGSLKDVYDLFTDTDARHQIVKQINDPELQEFWLDEFPRTSYRTRAPVITKLRPVVHHKLLAPILCSRESNFDPDAIIGERKIVLLDLSTGSHVTDVNTIVGTFVFTKLIAAAWRRGKQSQKDSSVKRIRHTLFVDEAQNYMHKEMGVQTIISEARKFKLTLALATTHIDLLNDSVRKAVINNMGLLAVFWVGPEDAAMFRRGFQGVTEEDIARLDIGQCIVRNHRTTSLVKTQFPLPLPPRDATGHIECRMREGGDPKRNNLRPLLSEEHGKPTALAPLQQFVCEGVT